MREAAFAVGMSPARRRGPKRRSGRRFGTERTPLEVWARAEAVEGWLGDVESLYVGRFGILTRSLESSIKSNQGEVTIFNGPSEFFQPAVEKRRGF